MKSYKPMDSHRMEYHFPSAAKSQEFTCRATAEARDRSEQE
jgi:hypothetical protein